MTFKVSLPLLVLLGSYWLGCQGLPLKLERAKKQAEVLEWTITEWSECSASCGGGLQTRSVRCLDTDGVISRDCVSENRPASYQFCGQVDCITGVPTPDALPQSDEYRWISGDGSSTTLLFNNQGGEAYTVQQNTTEIDQTRTVVDQSVTPSQISTTVQVFGRDNAINIQSSGDTSSLLVNGQSILPLNNIQQLRFVGGQGIRYNGGTISGLDGSPIVNGVNRLYFYDGLRFYSFDNNKINNLPGPGTLYFDPVSGTALYSSNLALISGIDSFLSTINPSEGTTEPSTTASPVSTDTPSATPPSASTLEPDTPSPSTVDTVTIAETEEPVTDEEEEEDSTSGKSRSSKTKSRSKSRKGTKRGKSPKKSKETKSPNEEESQSRSCTKNSCRERPESSPRRGSRGKSPKHTPQRESSRRSPHKHERSPHRH